MRSIISPAAEAVAAVLLGVALQASAAGPSCTCDEATGVPRCRATWEDATSKKADYEIRCEYACARGRDSWLAPEPECRAQPPCGQIYGKKRLYKSAGQETVERVPRYDVEMVSPRPCRCATCASGRGHGWDPFGILTFLHPH